MPNSRCEEVLDTGFRSSPFLPHVRREIDTQIILMNLIGENERNKIL